MAKASQENAEVSGDEDEEEDEGDESIENEERSSRRAAAERRHHRMASDLSIIESSAEMLYGLIHQRFICSRAGIQQMHVSISHCRSFAVAYVVAEGPVPNS